MKFTNIYRHMITTLVGLIIIGMSVWQIYQVPVSWFDALAALALGFTLLFAPDNMLAKLEKIINRLLDASGSSPNEK